MTTLPLADARANLSKLIEDASTTHERIEITKNGRRAAVLLGADDYDALHETIAVLSDPDLLRAHGIGLGEVDEGTTLSSEELLTLMKSSGRVDKST
jgi:prevent-host-death family protein